MRAGGDCSDIVVCLGRNDQCVWTNWRSTEWTSDLWGVSGLMESGRSLIHEMRPGMSVQFTLKGAQVELELEHKRSHVLLGWGGECSEVPAQKQQLQEVGKCPEGSVGWPSAKVGATQPLLGRVSLD